jgi:hypothetical protein
MKKLIVSLLVAFLMAAGLVAASGSAASAARCPYTGCIPTDTSGKAIDVRKPGKVRTTFRVGTNGNVVPKGAVKIVIKGNGVYRSKVVRYPGTNRASFRGLPRGSFQVFMKFIPARGSAFGRSAQTTVVTVR